MQSPSWRWQWRILTWGLRCLPWYVQVCGYMSFLAVVVLVFWVASGWRLSWVSLGTLVGGWWARIIDIIGHIVPCNTHTHTHAQATYSDSTFQSNTYYRYFQSLSLPLSHSVFSQLCTHSLSSCHSLCALYFFLLACSLCGGLLLFRRSRYKGHAKYKYKYIIIIIIIVIIIIIIIIVIIIIIIIIMCRLLRAAF